MSATAGSAGSGATRADLTSSTSAPGGPSATRELEDGELVAQRDAPVGGQAVLEGVMMRGVSTWAVAVRKPVPEDAAPDALGEVEVQSFPLTSALQKHRWLRLPVI